MFICALWSPAGKGLTSWLSFVVSICDFVTFPFAIGILGQVWYVLIYKLGVFHVNQISMYLDPHLN